MNLKLTPEQARAVASSQGESIRFVDPSTNEGYVLIKVEIYDRLQSFFADDTVFTTAEMLDRVMAEDDASDPQLAELQKKYGGVQA